MTTEHLKASIIDCFNHQHIYISFNDPDYITAVYEPNSRRFTQLVYGSLKIEL